MIADEELLTSLRTLGDTALGDAKLDRRVGMFKGALRQLRDDPAEAARIDAIVMDAELDQLAVRTVSGGADIIYVSGKNVTINRGHLSEAADAEARVNTALARLERQMQKLEETLEETSAQTRPRPRPQRIWETLLWPAAFGGGILAVLGAVTVFATVHASAAAMSVIGIILATATAVTALLSLWVPWTSVRLLNRDGDARKALELLRGSRPEWEDIRRNRGGRDDTAMPAGSAAARTYAEELALAASIQGEPVRQSDPHKHEAPRRPGTCSSCASPLAADDVFCGNCGRPAA